MRHRLGRPCPIKGGEPLAVMWSDPGRPEWPDNACAACTGDTRSIAARLADLEAGRPTTLDDGRMKRTRDAADALAADRARDQRATGPSVDEERRARELDEEQGTYRAFN